MSSAALGSKPLLDFTRETGSAARVLIPAVDGATITNPPRGLYVKTGGTFVWEDADVDGNGDPDPNSDTMTVTDETWIPFSPTKISSITGAVVYLVY